MYKKTGSKFHVLCSKLTGLFAVLCLLFTVSVVAQETPVEMVVAETGAIEETVAIKPEAISVETSVVPIETQTLVETKPLEEIKPGVVQALPPLLSLVRPGLSLMPTAYVRVSQKHPGETGLNCDFLFNFYIGEIYEYINNRHAFFTPYRIFMFGADAKVSFTLGQLLKAVGIFYGEEYFAGRLSNLLNFVDPDFSRQEQKYFPTFAVGLRGWLFRSMGPSFDLAEAFEGAEWILDYYVVVSKKIGDCGFHFGYVYGSFTNQFFKEIKRTNRMNQGQMWSWNVDGESDSNTFFVGFDMNVPWGTKKFTVESIFSSPNTFLINTSTGLWGFDLAFLKIPKGFSIIGYWSFRTNLFTF